MFLCSFGLIPISCTASVIQVFDKSRYTESVDKFQELNKLKDSLSTKTQQFEDVLKSLMVTMANSVQAISALKVASVDKVILESNKILFDILKSPYNQYSPILEYEEIERIRNEKFDYSEDVQTYEPFRLKPSSRMRYNLVTRMWTSEDGNTTNMPFGVHQIYEEIVAPIVQNLMAENRIERLKTQQLNNSYQISLLQVEHNKKSILFEQIISFPKFEKRVIVIAFSALIVLTILFITFCVSLAEILNTPMIKYLSVVISPILGLNTAKIVNKIVDSKKKSFYNLTIEELTKLDEENELKKKSLIEENDKIENLLIELEELTKQHSDKICELQKDIDLLNELREVCINQSCVEILNRRFDIEQEKLTFQKILKPNSKQN